MFLLDVSERHLCGKDLPHYQVVKDNWLKFDETIFQECVDEMKEFFSRSFLPLPGYLVGRPSSTGPFNPFGTRREFFSSNEFQNNFNMFLDHCWYMQWYDASWMAVKVEVLKDSKIDTIDGPRAFVPQGSWMNALCGYLFRSQMEQLKCSPFYYGGFSPFHGGYDVLKTRFLCTDGYYHEEDHKKFDNTYFKPLSDGIRDIRKSALPKKLWNHIDYVYQLLDNNPIWYGLIADFITVHNIIPSGHFLTSGDNSLRNFLRFFYHLKKRKRFTLNQLLENYMTCVQGDDSLIKGPLLNEMDLIIDAAELGIISKGFTSVVSTTIIGKSFCGMHFFIHKEHVMIHWDTDKLLASLRFRQGLNLEDFEMKVWCILLLLAPSSREFRIARGHALKFFNRPFPGRKFYLKYYGFTA